MSDSMDTCITVIPYKYREYAAPENIKAHYERISERRSKGLIFYDESTRNDVISREHDHIPILFAELWKQNQS